MKTPTLLLLALVLSGPLVAQERTLDYQPMKVLQTEQVMFPRRATRLGITSGEARIALQIDQKGNLTDSLLTFYTHPYFGDRAAEAVKLWKYEPAYINGQPHGATVELTFEFRSEGIVVVDLSPQVYLEQRQFSMGPQAYRFQVSALRDLDGIPTPRKIVKPNYPMALASANMRKIEVIFYIDESGRVRLPAVSAAVGQTEETLAGMAVDAVSQWEFEPPISKGRPVLVMARQEFNFEAKP